MRSHFHEAPPQTVKELPWEEAVHAEAIRYLHLRYLGQAYASLESPIRPKKERNWLASSEEIEERWREAVRHEYFQLERFYQDAADAIDPPTSRSLLDQAKHELDEEKTAKRLQNDSFARVASPLNALLLRAARENPILYARLRHQIDYAKQHVKASEEADPFETPTRPMRVNASPRQPQELSPQPAARQQTPEQREIERRWYFQYLPALKKFENPDALVPGGFDEIQRKVQELEQNPRLVASLRELRRKYGDWNG